MSKKLTNQNDNNEKVTKTPKERGALKKRTIIDEYENVQDIKKFLPVSDDLVYSEEIIIPSKDRFKEFPPERQQKLLKDMEKIGAGNNESAHYTGYSESTVSRKKRTPTPLTIEILNDPES